MNLANWHTLFSGILLGWGAAIPFGPINLEIMRRNLTFGASYGVALGIGACTADLIYVLLLGLGALTLLTHVVLLKVIGFFGALILAWFGYKALSTKSVAKSNTDKKPESLWKSWIEGCLLTLVSPFTVLFWASVSTQLITLTQAHEQAIIFAGGGVMLGTFSWICTFNTILNITRHKLTPKVLHSFNIGGGVILLCFAAYGIYRALAM